MSCVCSNIRHKGRTTYILAIKRVKCVTQTAGREKYLHLVYSVALLLAYMYTGDMLGSKQVIAFNSLPSGYPSIIIQWHRGRQSSLQPIFSGGTADLHPPLASPTIIPPLGSDSNPPQNLQRCNVFITTAKADQKDTGPGVNGHVGAGTRRMEVPGRGRWQMLPSTPTISKKGPSQRRSSLGGLLLHLRLVDVLTTI